MFSPILKKLSQKLQKDVVANQTIPCQSKSTLNLILHMFNLQHLFEVRIDDKQHTVSPPINDAHTHRDVKAYAAKDEPIADALIRNLIFTPDQTGTITPNYTEVSPGNLIKPKSAHP